MKINHPTSQSSWNQLYSEVLAQDDVNRLNVTPQASDQEIKTQFKKLSLQYHPDKNQDFEETATKVFKLLVESRDRLLECSAYMQQIRDRIDRAQQEEQAKRESWRNLQRTINARLVIDFLSLDEARHELAHNSQSNIPGFDKASALRERIDFLETKRHNNIICAVSCQVFAALAWYYIKHRMKANTNAPITKPATPATPAVDPGGVGCSL